MFENNLIRIWSFITVALSLFLHCSQAEIKTFDMAERCGETLDLKEEEIYGAFITYEYNIFKNSVCEFDIKAHNYYSQMMVYFEDFDIDCNHGNMTIYFYHEEFQPSLYLQRLPAFNCATNTTSNYFSPGQFMKFKFNRTSTTLRRAYFKAVIVVYNEGQCEDDFAYKCDNGRCINGDLACDTTVKTPCEVESDCDVQIEEASFWESFLNNIKYLAIIVGVLVVFSFLKHLHRTKYFDKWTNAGQQSSAPVLQARRSSQTLDHSTVDIVLSETEPINDRSTDCSYDTIGTDNHDHVQTSDTGWDAPPSYHDLDIAKGPENDRTDMKDRCQNANTGMPLAPPPSYDEALEMQRDPS